MGAKRFEVSADMRDCKAAVGVWDDDTCTWHVSSELHDAIEAEIADRFEHVRTYLCRMRSRAVDSPPIFDLLDGIIDELPKKVLS